MHALCRPPNWPHLTHQSSTQALSPGQPTNASGRTSRSALVSSSFAPDDGSSSFGAAAARLQSQQPPPALLCPWCQQPRAGHSITPALTLAGSAPLSLTEAGPDSGTKGGRRAFGRAAAPWPQASCFLYEMRRFVAEGLSRPFSAYSVSIPHRRSRRDASTGAATALPLPSAVTALHLC